MIKADHQWWAKMLFHPFMGIILRKDFSRFFLTNPLPKLSNTEGLLVTPNHISWWDGFFIDFIGRKLLHRKIYLMMLLRQLALRPFFRFLGAYSIEPGDRKEVIESLGYTREILGQSDSFAVIYPQGEIVPQRAAPLIFRESVPFVLRGLKDECQVLPVLFLVKPYNLRRPEIWCRFGPLRTGSEVAADYPRFTELVNEELLLLEDSILSRSYTEDLFGRETE